MASVILRCFVLVVKYWLTGVVFRMLIFFDIDAMIGIHQVFQDGWTDGTDCSYCESGYVFYCNVAAYYSLVQLRSSPLVETRRHKLGREV